VGLAVEDLHASDLSQIVLYSYADELVVRAAGVEGGLGQKPEIPVYVLKLAEKAPGLVLLEVPDLGRGRVRTCVWLCVAGILRPPPPSFPFGSALSRMVESWRRNET